MMRHSFAVTISCFTLLSLGRTDKLPGQEWVWPGREWATATPESQGLSSAKLRAAAEYAQQAGPGTGCVIRHGYLVREWGDPKAQADIKSAVKGSIGCTLLGVAVRERLLSVDDRLVEHWPDFVTGLTEGQRRWRDEITVRHMATMAAGFDDGRPPKLYYRPGTAGEYSNDTANMLAELLTLRFRRDLADVLRREVCEPIDLPDEDWTWRPNQFRPKELKGLTTREFASGVRITHGGLARIGLLYLRGGEWNGRRVLPKEFVKEATRPTDLPTFNPYYGFYWGGNGRGTFPHMPEDTFFASGLGDSWLIVCPSLDLVVVRCGTGSTKSHLPGPDDPQQGWGGRIELFFKQVADAIDDAARTRQE